MTIDELRTIIDNHVLWLLDKTGGVRANLSGADLSWADLSRANLSGANLSAFMVCPEVGSFTAYKKGRNDEIITLTIPSSARRTSSLVGRECRASEAKVVSIINNDGEKLKSCLCWNSDYSFEYHVGKMVVPDTYDDDIRVECTSGIHFFITKQEAIDR